MARDRIYLDHAATTPVLAEARSAIGEALEHWANPSSPHADGRAARAALEEARARIAEALGWRHDVILTSGATEAIAIAAARAGGGRRLLGATEHDAVVAAMGADAEVIPVDERGLVDLAALAQALGGGPALVAIQQVNNETGVIQPVAQIADKVRATGSLLLADCAQGAGKIALPDADFIALSAHKLGGPPGLGALLVKDIATLAPSGGQEKGYRRGTENLPAAAGLAAALQSRAFADAMPRLTELRAQLEEAIASAGGLVVAGKSERIATIGAYAMPGVSSASQLVQLDLTGIAVSAGSACSSGSMKPSRVLEAMAVPPEIAGCVIRISFGPDTSADDVDRMLTEWRRLAAKAGARAA
ncbi:aminotransferase class V-fold PLP-dependent enzyme [Sphingomonas sp.]|uniref:cysteine desulfurase family protein n=1 Tax=Sphingomonas sp. TaxID=28214 RepID=UPI0018466BC2|nr:aminotransferase class V-fold PLP-dependent enzyme [Sphingomonas sp.]MBA3510604.1 aminotransferase class V-fold PLP-dependent enzyme [Sphingomonas sp.]